MVAGRPILAPMARILGSIGPMMLLTQPVHSVTIVPIAIFERPQTCCLPQMFLFTVRSTPGEFVAHFSESTWPLLQGACTTFQAIIMGGVPISLLLTDMRNLTDGSAGPSTIQPPMWIIMVSTGEDSPEPPVDPTRLGFASTPRFVAESVVWSLLQE